MNMRIRGNFKLIAQKLLAYKNNYKISAQYREIYTYSAKQDGDIDQKVIIEFQKRRIHDTSYLYLFLCGMIEEILGFSDRHK